MNSVYLINLIKNSHSLFDDEKDDLIKRLWDFNEEKLEKLINIFENEQKRFKKIEQDYNQTVENIWKQYKIKIWEWTLELKSEQNTKNKLQNFNIKN